MKIIQKYRHLLLVVSIFGAFSYMLLGQGSAFAYVNRDLNEGQVPYWVTNGYPGYPYNGRCTQADGTVNAAGQGSWVSTDQGSAWFNQTAATVSSGTTTLPLYAVFSGVWCVDVGTNVDNTRHRVTSVNASGGASVSGIGNLSVFGHDYPSTPYDINGSGTGGFWPAVSVNAAPIILNIPGNLPPGNHTFNVNLNGVTRINHFSNGIYSCVGSGGDRTGDPNNFGACQADDFSFPVTITVLPPPDAPVAGGIDSWGCDIGDFTYTGRNSVTSTTRAALVGSVQDPDYNNAPDKFTEVDVYINKVNPNNLGEMVYVGSYQASYYPRSLGGNPINPPIGFGQPGFPNWHDWFVVPKADLDRFGDAYAHDVFVFGIGKNADGSNNGDNREIFKQPGNVRATMQGCAIPTCRSANIPATTEVNSPISVDLGFSYSPGYNNPAKGGRAIRYSLPTDFHGGASFVPGGDKPETNGNWSVNGVIEAGTWTREDIHTFSGTTTATTSSYDLTWEVQWLIPNDPALRAYYNALGPTYTTTGPNVFGNVYANLKCNNGGDKLNVSTNPYFRVYGNDIAAGGQFKASCDAEATDFPNKRASILALNKYVSTPTDGWMGASGQLASFALGEIWGFSSGGNQSPRRSVVAQSPVNGLTFGNYGDAAIGPAGGSFNWDTGGAILDPNRVVGYGGKSGLYRCMDDYFTKISASIGGTVDTSSTTASLSGPAKRYKPVGGKVTVAGNVTGKQAIVVEGDVYIGPAGISYAGYTGVANMPSLYIIAKGNIYIDQAAPVVSGVLIAQPVCDSSGCTKGVIYTCANNSGAIQAGGLQAGCNTTLTINGAFIAQDVKLLRTKGTTKNSAENEIWSSTNIAEIFKSSAELYLSAPDALRKSGSNAATYDSITSLPPIL